MENCKTNITVARLPLKEVSKRIYNIHNDLNIMNEIIKLAATENGYNNGAGLVIIFDRSENIFIVLNSNPMYSSLTKSYDSTKKNIKDSFDKDDLENYEFLDNSKFSKEEFRIVEMALKMPEEPVSKLLVKCVKEMINK